MDECALTSFIRKDSMEWSGVHSSQSKGEGGVGGGQRQMNRETQWSPGEPMIWGMNV